MNNKIDVKVTEVVEVNELIKRFRFAALDGSELPPFSGGAHIVVEMHDGELVRQNPYSLMSAPDDTSSYAISVRRDDEGRGGSLFMHRQVSVGDQMRISPPVNLFNTDSRAKKHLMIAGGIGITPFIAQMAQLSDRGEHFELHYSVRSRSLGAYTDTLRQHYDRRVHVYHDDEDERIDLVSLLAMQPLGTHVYVCGPKGMIQWVLDTAETEGWPSSSVHYEHFLAPPVGETFEVTLATSNKTIQVAGNQSLLEAMEAADVDAPYLCRGGACGQCETRVLSCEGSIQHNDHWLDDDEQQAGEKIMPCVSRFQGKSLVIDR